MARPRPTLKDVVRRRVRELRDERGWTQEQLCERAGISSDAISRIEGGSRAPGLDTIERLADAFGVAPTAFFEGAPPVRPNPAPPPAVRRVVALLETRPADVQQLIEEMVGPVVRFLDGRVRLGNAHGEVEGRRR